MITETPMQGGGNTLSQNVIIVRRTLALGDVLCSTVVADKLAQQGFEVNFQAHPAAHPILLRIRSVSRVLEPNGYADIDLDATYENDPERRKKHFHQMFIAAANQQLQRSGISVGVPTNCRPRLRVSSQEKQAVRQRFEHYPKPWVFICPRSESYPHRQVPDASWVDIAHKTQGTKFWLGFHPAPPGIVDLQCRHVDNLILWLAVADLLISVDTGPLHIGAALGIPIVAILQSSSPDQHLNDQNDFVTVSTGLDCLNCQKNVCPINAHVPPCFQSDTMILACTGHKQICDISVGEKVWTGVSWQKVTEVMKTPYDGPGIEIWPVYGRGNPIRVTPEHPFWVRQKGWVKAGQLTNKDYLKLSLPFGREEAYFTHSKTGNELLTTTDEWWTVGYFIGDGWVSGKRVSFAVSKKDEARILPKLRKTIGVCRKPGNSVTCSTFEARSKTWSEVFSGLGHKAHGKKLPSWVLNAKESHLRAMVKGYIDSDGSRDGKYLKFTSTSRALLLGFQLIFWKLGYTASVTFFKRPATCVILGRTVNQRSTYTLSATPQRMINKRQIRWTRKFWMNRRQPYIKVREIKPCDLGPFVYNLTVEKDHTYTANNIYNHNCQQVNTDNIAAWANARLAGQNSEMVSAVVAIYQPKVEVMNHCLNDLLPQVSEIIVTRAQDGILPKHYLQHPKIKYVVAPGVRLGYGKNLNYGARHANGKYLLLVNDDVFLTDPKTVPHLVEQMQKDPKVGVVSHLLRYPSGKIYHAGVDRQPGARDWGHIDHDQWHPTFKDVTELENMCGTSILVRREAFYQIGGYDEDYFLYSEDNDFAMRMRLHGWKILFTPHVCGQHLNHQSTEKLGDIGPILRASNELFHHKWGAYLKHNLMRVPGNFSYLNQ